MEQYHKSIHCPLVKSFPESRKLGIISLCPQEGDHLPLLDGQPLCKVVLYLRILIGIICCSPWCCIGVSSLCGYETCSALNCRTQPGACPKSLYQVIGKHAITEIRCL